MFSLIKPGRRPLWGIFLLTGIFSLTIFGAVAVAAQPPNIVLILADDMGYGDIQALNSASTIPTPHLNSLARDGMSFVDAHSPSAVCTPTRYALLTGRYCWRTSLKRGVLNGYSKPLIDKDRPTFASVLSDKYVTGIVGKWHLGLGFVDSSEGDSFDYRQPVTHGPNDLGFHYSYIIPASLDFPPYVYLENGKVTDADTVTQPAQKFPPFLRKGPRSKELDMEGCLDHLTDRAVEFINEQAKGEKPFLLYFPLTAPHKPVLPATRFRGQTDLGPYGDFIVQVDDTVGRVLKAIESADVRENTIVIYSSDNGSFMYRRDGNDHVDDATIQAYRPEHHQANGILRGTKADIWEAGHRVPCLVRWPAAVQAGSTCSATICLVDMLATMAELNEIDKPESAQDSFSVLPLLKGANTHDRPPVINHSAAGMFAIRDGKWKLVLGNGSGGREKPSGKRFSRPYQLFDLENDPTESQDLISKHPEIAAKMEQACLQIIGPDR